MIMELYIKVNAQETYEGTMYHHVIFASSIEMASTGNHHKIEFGSLTCSELGCFVVHRRSKIHIYANKDLTQKIISAFG
jgi:hypothetical protein